MTENKTSRRRLTALFLALLMLLGLSGAFGKDLSPLPFGTVSAAGITENKKNLSSLQDKYNRAVGNRNAVQSKLNAKRGEIRTKEQEKRDLDEEITVLTEELMAAEALLEEYGVYIEEKTQSLEDLETKHTEQQAMLGDMLRMSYEYGETSYLDIILGADSISDFLQRLDFLAYHMKYSSTLLRDMDKTEKELTEVTANLESARTALTEIAASKEQLKGELEVKLARAEEVLAELRSEEDAYEREAAQYESDRLALEKDIKALSATIAAQEAEEKRKQEEAKKKQQNTGGSSSGSSNVSRGGKLGWPLNGYSLANKSSNYGYRTDPITGRKGAFHNGVDIAVPYGTKILAAEAGTVVRSSWYSTYGNCVIVDHGGGLMTLYAHCSGYNCSVGDKVSRGECIAYVGSTGNSTGNHLHFVVFVNGVTTNPIPYIS